MANEPLFDAMCIGAHPDDVEIGMGATLAGIVRRGGQAVIVDLTNGEPTPFGTLETRAVESAEAARILGAERRTLTQANRYLFDTVDARIELAQVIREFRPRTLFIPYADDAHPDHIAASAIAVAARFYAKFTKTDMLGEPFFPQRIYRYMAVHMRVVAEPSFIVDVSDDLPTKIAALQAYRSQFADNVANAGVVDLMRQQAAMWGALGRVEAGEPFFALETLALRTTDDLI
jgi:bacillithiol biosynthesis deacetylase BshB1